MKKCSRLFDRKTLLALMVPSLITMFSPPAMADDEGGGPSVAHGRHLFFDETFGGNGQACGTCHRSNFDQQLAFSPGFAQVLHFVDADDPLFLPINSADAVGTNFAKMFANGTVPIPITIPPNVDVEGVTAGAVVNTRTDGSRFIYLARKTPTLVNIALKSQLMLDGREGTDFEKQAVDAADTHFGAHRPLTTGEQADLAAFQQAQFSNDKMEDLFRHGTPRQLPQPTNSVEAVGYAMMQANGKCGQCHGGPNLNLTTQFNVLDSFVNAVFPGSAPPGVPFQTNFSGGTQFNIPPESAIHDTDPVYKFTVHSVDDNGNPAPDELGEMVRVFYSADPGALLTTHLDGRGNAHLCRVSFSACLVNGPSPLNGFVASAREIFVIPSLWDIGDRLAVGDSLMHHGQAHNMADVMAIYTDLFAVTAAGLEQLTGQDESALFITQAEADGITAYLENRMRSHVDGE